MQQRNAVRQIEPPLSTWLAAREAWFDSNPQREFQLAKLTSDELSALAQSGLVVGAFDGPLLNGNDTLSN